MFRKPKRIPPRGPRPLSQRDKVLNSWRGVQVAALEKAFSKNTRSTADILPRVLADLRIDTRRAEAEIVRVWNHALDPEIVAHSQPAGIHKGTLFVNVDSSSWLCEIVRYRRREILNRLQHSFGSERIARISFRVGLVGAEQ
jgi:hypothetical protein